MEKRKCTRRTNSFVQLESRRGLPSPTRGKPLAAQRGHVRPHHLDQPLLAFIHQPIPQPHDQGKIRVFDLGSRSKLSKPVTPTNSGTLPSRQLSTVRTGISGRSPGSHDTGTSRFWPCTTTAGGIWAARLRPSWHRMRLS